jgi:hypothetical protein
VRVMAERTALLRNAMQAPNDWTGDQTLVYGFARQLDDKGPLNDQTVAMVQGNPEIGATVQRILNTYLKGERLGETDRRLLQQAIAAKYRENRDAFGVRVMPFERAATRLRYPWQEIIAGAEGATDAELAPFLRSQRPNGARATVDPSAAVRNPVAAAVTQAATGRYAGPPLVLESSANPIPDLPTSGDIQWSEIERRERMIRERDNAARR